MAMEVIQIIPAAHEDALAGIAYNPINKQVYTCAEGDKAIKVCIGRRSSSSITSRPASYPAHGTVTAPLSPQVWDLKTGQLLRTQTVHRGMVTCLAYTTSAKLLFSGSIDGSIGVWTDKGNLLQVSSSTAASHLSPGSHSAVHPSLQPAGKALPARADCRWCPRAGQCSAWHGATSSGCWWQAATVCYTYTRCARRPAACFHSKSACAGDL